MPHNTSIFSVCVELLPVDRSDPAWRKASPGKTLLKCSACGFVSEVKNVAKARCDAKGQHSKGTKVACKRAKAEASGSSIVASVAALEAELSHAKTRIAELESRPTTVNIHTSVQITIEPLVLKWRDGQTPHPQDRLMRNTYVGRETISNTLPARTFVQDRLQRISAATAVPTYLMIKHFLTGPQFMNLRVSADGNLEVVGLGLRGEVEWGTAASHILVHVVYSAFCELEKFYHVSRLPNLNWDKWIAAETLKCSTTHRSLHGKEYVTEDFDNEKPAYKKTVDDVKAMIAKQTRIINDTREPYQSHSDENEEEDEDEDEDEEEDGEDGDSEDEDEEAGEGEGEGEEDGDSEDEDEEEVEDKPDSQSSNMLP